MQEGDVMGEQKDLPEIEVEQLGTRENSLHPEIPPGENPVSCCVRIGKRRFKLTLYWAEIHDSRSLMVCGETGVGVSTQGGPGTLLWAMPHFLEGHFRRCRSAGLLEQEPVRLALLNCEIEGGTNDS